jgi:hypothetical protein
MITDLTHIALQPISLSGDQDQSVFTDCVPNLSDL